MVGSMSDTITPASGGSVSDFLAAVADPRRRADLANRARRRAERRFTAARMARDYLALYEELHRGARRVVLPSTALAGSGRDSSSSFTASSPTGTTATPTSCAG